MQVSLVAKVVARKTYHTTKLDALTSNLDSATAVGLYTQFHTTCTAYKHTKTYGWGIHNRYTTTRSTVPNAWICRSTQKGERMTCTAQMLHTSGDSYTCLSRGHGKSGTPPCGRSPYYHYRKSTRHIGTPMNGRSFATMKPTHSDVQ